jgi:hypothetical protein
MIRGNQFTVNRIETIIKVDSMSTFEKQVRFKIEKRIEHFIESAYIRTETSDYSVQYNRMIYKLKKINRGKIASICSRYL